MSMSTCSFHLQSISLSLPSILTIYLIRLFKIVRKLKFLLVFPLIAKSQKRSLQVHERMSDETRRFFGDWTKKFRRCIPEPYHVIKIIDISFRLQLGEKYFQRIARFTAWGSDLLFSFEDKLLPP